MSSVSSTRTLTSHGKEDDNKDKKQLDHLLHEQGLHRSEDDENVICWDEDSKDLPLNWTVWPKVYNNAVVTFLEFYMTAISTAGTAAGKAAQPEYGVSLTVSYLAFSSVYLIGQSVGGLLVSPLSESIGSMPLYVTSNLVFCVMAILTGTIHSIIPVFISRFIAGFAAAIPATVAFGSFEDQHTFERRIWVTFFYNMIGNSGLALGPVYAAYLVDTVGWRYIYYIGAIVAGVATFLSCFMTESRSSRILEDKIKKIKKETGNDKLKPEGAKEKMTVKKFVMQDLPRPIIYLVTEPIVTLCATLLSISYALVYGLTESLAIVYTLPGFAWPEANASLAFLAVALGIWLDVLPRFYDSHLFKNLKAQGKQITAEHKIRSFAVACPVLAIGLWIFAWTIPPRVIGVYWFVSFIGITLVGFSANDFSYVLFGYVTDVYGSEAASAVSALAFARTLVASSFPLFTTQMYQGLGANVATSIFAAVATLFAITPWLFLGHAQMLKKISKNAKQDDDSGEEGDEEQGGEKNQGEESEDSH